MPSHPARRLRHRGAAVVGFAVLLAASGPTGLATAAPTPTPAATPGSNTLTVEQALTQAQKSGKAVDATGATTPTDTVRANPDGTLTLTRTAAPVRKRVHDSWTALDPTLGRASDGTLSPAVTTSSLTLSGGGTGPLATMVSEGKQLALTAPMRLPTPTIDGATATYANVLSGVDLRVTADLYGGFSEIFVIHDATAAANPALKRMTLATDTSGVMLDGDEAGNITATDRLGQPVFTAPAPIMWDSATPEPATSETASPSTKTNSAGRTASDGPDDASHTAPVAVNVTASGIDLAPDATMLTAASTVYPLYIDPAWTPVTASKSGWATIPEDFPSTNYWNKTPDPHGFMQVGNSGEIWSRTLINFPIATSTLAGATIQSATFDITNSYSFSCNAREVNVYAPSTTLTSSNAKWNSWSGVSLGSVVDSANVAYGYNSSCPAHGIGFNVLDTVKADVTANKKTQTFALRAADETDDLSWKEFSPTSPKLTITYNHPPRVPTGMTTSPATSCTASPPTTIGDGPVSLYAPVSDPDGGSLGVTFRLWKTVGGDPAQPLASSNPSTLTYTSGTTAVFPVARTILAAAAGNTVTQFSWQVRVTDTTATTVWSALCSFNYDATRFGAPTITAPETITVGTAATFTVNPPVADTVPTRYSYQLNGGAPGTINTTDGNAAITVTPTRFTNTLTVTSLSTGGNFGDTAVLTFNATPATDAADGDLTGDGNPDLLTVGEQNSLPAGLWLAPHKNGALIVTATDIGANGRKASNKPGDFTGAQAITGRFTNNHLQDVLVYYPAGPNKGEGPLDQDGVRHLV